MNRRVARRKPLRGLQCRRRKVMPPRRHEAQLSGCVRYLHSLSHGRCTPLSRAAPPRHREVCSVPAIVRDVQIETIFDEPNDHYELVYAGWNGPYRIHGSVLHFDIRDGKVWIQHDGTEGGIADELVELGIPKDRIVLAYK